jgi:hypothetical protein
LLQSFSKVWILLSFKVNQEYIAKALCINRSKPEMHCNGNCILMQRLKAAEEQEKKEIPQKLKEHHEILYCFDIKNWLLPSPVDVVCKKQLLTFYLSPCKTSFVTAVFRPPQMHTA